MGAAAELAVLMAAAKARIHASAGPIYASDVSFRMVDFARRGADGILNALCFNCMLGTVSSAVTGRIRSDHDGIPIANLVYSAVQGANGRCWRHFCTLRSIS